MSAVDDTRAAPAEADALPAPLRVLVDRATRRRGLARAERREVARELEDYFADGLRAGHAIAELAAAFGDAELAGALIVRARRRSRYPLRRTAAWVACAATAGVLATYATSAVRLHTARPQTSSSGADISALASIDRARSKAASSMSAIRLAAADLLARVYSDDGHGDGRASAAGLRLLQALRGKPRPGIGARVLEPAIFVGLASRTSAEIEMARILGAADREMHRGSSAAADAIVNELARRAAHPGWSLRYYPVAAISLRLANALEAR